MMEFLTSVTFFIWFTIFAVIGTIISLEKQKEGFANLFVCLALIVFGLNYGKVIWVFVSTNIATTIYFTLAYLMIGVCWSFFKWNEKVSRIFKKFKSIKTAFVAKQGEIDSTNKKQFINKLDGEFRDSDNWKISFYDSDTFEVISKKITPIGLNNKALIISWISYWPLSLVGTLLNNPFRRIFEFLYEQASGTYDKITKRHKTDAFKDLND